MNWWSILKVQQTLDVGYNPQNPVQEGAVANPNMLPNMHQSVPDPNNPQRLNRVKTQTNITEQQDQQMATGTEAATQQTGITQPQHRNLYGTKPIETTTNITNTAQNTTSAAAGGEDDSDVGDIRQNKEEARQNLVQQPKGAFAAELTEIINILSRTIIDPANQRDAAIEAKKKLHSIFPSSMA